MQILFKEITSGGIDAVRKRPARNPGSVALVATSPPKKYAGQSPLMIVLKTGRFEIATLLLDHGADVNSIDGEGPTRSRRALRLRTRRPISPRRPRTVTFRIR
ncbi:hypothetical protein [Streptomyces sp. NPDC057496]|uniref:hypothetical protein n=1 Tax=Streptomyces sp. NPDC057496 TaxID=3346149 RepID=UPI0036B915DD